MGILVSIQELEKSYGGRRLFTGLSFGIEAGERIGLVGPNGAGKSTLMNILAGNVEPDQGQVIRSKGLRIGFLMQEPQLDESKSILDHLLAQASDPGDTSAVFRELAHLPLEEAGHSPESLLGQLSGGWKKRVALAAELIKEPDLLLLDEPTNHLDIESILWLESLLTKANFATLTITHDRYFLQQVSSRILDLDPRNPKGILSIQGNYSDYLQAKEELLSAQLEQEKSLRNTFRKEQEWLRAGAQARQTKQKARAERAIQMGEDLGDLGDLNRQQSAKIDFQSAGRSPKKLIEAQGLKKGYEDKLLFQDLDLLITPKTRLGIIGRNGTGKSTLIKILTGAVQPDEGQIQYAEKLQISHFEQNKDELDPKLSLLESICAGGGDYVDFKGQFVYGRSYLSRFLFRPEQMELPVGRLSGGERSRLRIAQLMLEKANLLILDEPTNDLDLETLRVLEESLADFNGAILLVSHDRFFLDQVCHDILAFPDQNNGKLEKFTGYDQWEQWRKNQNSFTTPESLPDPKVREKKKTKLSYKEQREWDSMEETILETEEKLEELKRQSMEPEVVSSSDRLIALTQEMSNLDAKLQKLYERWQELEQMQLDYNS